MNTYNSMYGGKQKLSIVRPNQIKVPFVKTGEWKHDAYGVVKFTDEDIDRLVENFERGVTGFTPYLTLGHLDEEPESTDSHRKRGDLRDIIVEGDTAYGIFDVNDKMYEAVQNGEYEYSSGEFNRKFTSKESGEDLGTAVIRVALTNSPFLPFGDSKVQALSDNSESCPETRENYVFLLSIDTSNSDKTTASKEEVPSESAEEPKKEEETTPEVELSQTTQDVPSEDKAAEAVATPEPESEVVPEEPQALSETVEEPTPEPIENTKLPDNSSIMAKDNIKPVETDNAQPAAVTTEDVTAVTPEAPSKLESTDEVVIKDSNPLNTEHSAQAAQSEQVLANLTSQLQKVQDLYQAQLEAANATIKDLADKVNTLTDKLAGQEKVTQAFSTSMSQAQENQMIANMQSQGVLPATIQKFVAFKNAFQSAENKNIVKFSVGAGEEAKEVEANVIDTVADLLISASNQTPLVEQQLGISAGRKRGAYDFSSIIAANAAAAEKLNAE